MSTTWVVARCRVFTQSAIISRYDEFFPSVIGPILEFYVPQIEDFGAKRLLLPNYLFARPGDVDNTNYYLWETQEPDLYGFLRVRRGGVALISDTEMQTFRQAVDKYKLSDEERIREGCVAEIVRGPLKGNVCTVEIVMEEKARVCIEKAPLDARVYISLKNLRATS